MNADQLTPERRTERHTSDNSRDVVVPPTIGGVDVDVDVDQLLRGTGHDTELARELIDLFQNDLPTTLQRLAAAITAADFETVLRLAHSLKSPLTLFGANQAFDQCHEMELAAKQSEVAGLAKTFHQLRKELADVSQALTHVLVETL